jgi:hypothetical protein
VNEEGFVGDVPNLCHFDERGESDLCSVHPDTLKLGDEVHLHENDEIKKDQELDSRSDTFKIVSIVFGVFAGLLLIGIVMVRTRTEKTVSENVMPAPGDILFGDGDRSSNV